MLTRRTRGSRPILATTAGRLLSSARRAMPWRHLGLATLVAAFGWTGAAPAPAASNLPELGDSTAGILSDAEEERLGQRLMLQARSQFRFVDDPELTGYLNDLGRRLASHSDAPDRSYRFLLIDDSLLNAFAAPGGFIAVYSGLWLATETESELAAVMGHEVAHITQKHLQRMAARAKQQSLPTAAAVVAAVLLGGQAGAAALTTANAVLLDDQLRYSRDFEREADAIGIRILAESGFDVNAMASFFGKLERESRLMEGNVPEFLRTHPLSTNRIAEAESRAHRYPARSPQPTEAFDHAQAKLRAVSSDDPARVAAQFADDLANGRLRNPRAGRYGYALALAGASQYEQALKEIDALVAQTPDQPRYIAGRAQILSAAGRFDDALPLLADGAERFPEYKPLWHYYADVLLRTGRAAEARPLLRKRIREDPADPELYRKLARAAGESGNLAEGHQAMAEHYYLTFDYDAAIDQLETARKHAGDSAYLQASIDARLEQIRDEYSRLKALDE